MAQDRIYTREKHAGAKAEAPAPQIHPIVFSDDDYIRVRLREALVVRELHGRPRFIRFPYAEIKDFLNANMDPFWQNKRAADEEHERDRDGF